LRPSERRYCDSAVTASWAFLAEPPSIPGLGLRSYRGEEDLPAMCRVKAAAEAADGVDQLSRLEDFVVAYRNLRNCDPATDVVLAEVDGEVVAYQRVTWREEYTGARRYEPFCFVVPEARRRGLGAALLAHGEARLRQIAAAHPDGEKTFEVSCSGSEAGAATLYAAAGYLPALHAADMLRPDLEGIPDAPVPAGLVVRPPRDDELRRVWDAEVEAFVDHLGAAPPGEEGYREMLEFPDLDPSLWRVAWDGDEVAGQVRSFIVAAENEAMGRRRGYTENISVRQPYRRRGLARSLLVQSLHALKERGMEEAALSVLTENLHGAFRLYESVGFRVVRRWTTLRKPLA